MKKNEFKRADGLFSLCGLNCGLCPMKIRGECGGCFFDSPCYPTCSIAPCSVRHGNVDYCFQCEEYPCARYDDIDKRDSLISHRNQKKDLAKAKQIGIEEYLDEQRTKIRILNRLLKEYDDGKKDVFFCLAVNLLDVDDLTVVLDLASQTTDATTRAEKAAFVERALRDRAKEKGVSLILRN